MEAGWSTGLQLLSLIMLTTTFLTPSVDCLPLIYRDDTRKGCQGCHVLSSSKYHFMLVIKEHL